MLIRGISIVIVPLSVVQLRLPDPYGDGGSRKKQKQQLEDGSHVIRFIYNSNCLTPLLEIQFMQSLGWIADTDRRSGVGTMEIERKNRFEDAFRISAPAGGSRGMDMHRRRVGDFRIYGYSHLRQFDAGWSFGRIRQFREW